MHSANSKAALVAICHRCKHQRCALPCQFHTERFGADCPAIELREYTYAAAAAAARMANLRESDR